LIVMYTACRRVHRTTKVHSVCG